MNEDDEFKVILNKIVRGVNTTKECVIIALSDGYEIKVTSKPTLGLLQDGTIKLHRRVEVEVVKPVIDDKMCLDKYEKEE